MITEQELKSRSWFIVSLVCMPLVIQYRNWYWQVNSIWSLYSFEASLLALSFIGTVVYWTAGWFWAKRLNAQQDYVRMLREQPNWITIIMMILLVIIALYLALGTQSRREYFLWEAVRMNNTEMVASLLDKGVDPNIKNDHGITPLGVAVSERAIETMNVLIEHKHGAKPDFRERVDVELNYNKYLQRQAKRNKSENPHT